MVMMEIAQIGIVIKHIGDFEEENRGFQATSSNTCLRLCQWESEFKIGSPWVFGSESVGPMSASSSPLVTNGNSPRWKGTKNASEVNWPKARIEIWSVLKDLRSQNV